ncbi:MAG: hypothetical protein P8183_23485, partial [Anaerolineae bacterium]
QQIITKLSFRSGQFPTVPESVGLETGDSKQKSYHKNCSPSVRKRVFSGPFPRFDFADSSNLGKINLRKEMFYKIGKLCEF